MNQKFIKELINEKEKNEIFYSLPHTEILHIDRFLKERRDPNCIDVVIGFQQKEMDDIFKLLSTTYILPNKEQIDMEIWENFLANKIMKQLTKKEGIYFPQNLDKEKELLASFDIGGYLANFPKRTNMQTIEHVACNQTKKLIRIHYFPNNLMPIDLQKVIGKIFSTSYCFTNMLYTTQNSIHSYYKQGENWTLENDKYQELWKFYNNLKGNEFLWE